LEACNQALKVEPANARAFYVRGSLEAATHYDFEAAVADASKALELNPQYVQAHGSRGNYKAHLGDDVGAAADEEMAMKLNPQYAYPYAVRGRLRYDAHDFANALADFRKFCQLDLGHAQDYGRFRIWLIRARLGDPASATRELQTYLQSRKPRNSNDWPLQIARFLAGGLSEPELLHAAENPDQKKNDDCHCEAWFYAGSKRLIDGDPVTAADDFNKCLATGVKNFDEYLTASAELKSLSATNEGPPRAQIEIRPEHPRRLQQVLGPDPTPWKGYDQLIASHLNTKWLTIIAEKDFTPAKVVAKFRLHEDGSVSDIKISGDDVHATYCEASIMQCAPFPQWPDELQTGTGLGIREVIYTFEFR